MASVWDDPDLRAGGEFVKLDNKGDKISGLINAIRSHRFDDGGVAPQILFVDVEKRAGGKTLKHIEIVVNRGGKPAQTSPATVHAVAPAPDMAAVLAQLSPEQRAALSAHEKNNTGPGF
jgi:hypothetical protein